MGERKPGEIHKRGEQSNERTGGLHLNWNRKGKVAVLALMHLFHENRSFCEHCLL